MEKSLLRNIVIGLVVLIVLAVVVVVAIRQSPSADEEGVTVQEEQAFTSIAPATVWGIVKWDDGSIASGVTVTIAGIGQTTNAKGEYAVSIYQVGALPVEFELDKKPVLAVDAAQAEVDVSEGISIRRDFVVEKSS